MAIILGFVANGIKRAQINTEPQGDDCCHEAQIDQQQRSFRQKISSGLKYAFITLPKDIGLEVIIGIAVASFITVCEPLQEFIQAYLIGVLGYVFVLLTGLITYVCSTASVPMADALIQSGMSQGQALCYLIVGPVTSYGTILVIRKDFGIHVLSLYLSIICITSLVCGTILDIFVG